MDPQDLLKEADATRRALQDARRQELPAPDYTVAFVARRLAKGAVVSPPAGGEYEVTSVTNGDLVPGTRPLIELPTAQRATADWRSRSKRRPRRPAITATPTSTAVMAAVVATTYTRAEAVPLSCPTWRKATLNGELRCQAIGTGEGEFATLAACQQGELPQIITETDFIVTPCSCSSWYYTGTSSHTCVETCGQTSGPYGSGEACRQANPKYPPYKPVPYQEPPGPDDQEQPDATKGWRLTVLLGGKFRVTTEKTSIGPATDASGYMNPETSFYRRTFAWTPGDINGVITLGSTMVNGKPRANWRYNPAVTLYDSHRQWLRGVGFVTPPSYNIARPLTHAPYSGGVGSVEFRSLLGGGFSGGIMQGTNDVFSDAGYYDGTWYTTGAFSPPGTSGYTEIYYYNSSNYSNLATAVLFASLLTVPQLIGVEYDETDANGVFRTVGAASLTLNPLGVIAAYLVDDEADYPPRMIYPNFNPPPPAPPPPAPIYPSLVPSNPMRRYFGIRWADGSESPRLLFTPATEGYDATIAPAPNNKLRLTVKTGHKPNGGWCTTKTVDVDARGLNEAPLSKVTRKLTLMVPGKEELLELEEINTSDPHEVWLTQASPTTTYVTVKRGRERAKFEWCKITRYIYHEGELSSTVYVNGDTIPPLPTEHPVDWQDIYSRSWVYGSHPNLPEVDECTQRFGGDRMANLVGDSGIRIEDVPVGEKAERNIFLTKLKRVGAACTIADEGADEEEVTIMLPGIPENHDLLAASVYYTP